MMAEVRSRPYILRLAYSLYRHTAGKIAVWGLGFFLLIALTADFIAADRPIICSYEGTIYTPVINQYFGKRAGPFREEGYSSVSYDWAVWPPVRFGPKELHLDRGRAVPPLSDYEDGTHWVGSDDLGRDVFSGLIHGTRTALAIAFLSMGIAFLIGITLGIGAGYLGDGRWRVYPDVALLFGLGLVFAVYSAIWSLASIPAVFLLIFFILAGYAYVRDRWIGGGVRKMGIPADGTVLRMMELLRAIPDLFLLLAALAIMRNTDIFRIALLIGILRWPSIARYVRAEVLRIRNAPFIEVARMQGKKTWRIMWTYLMPNAVGPALIAVVFGMSSAVLIEAALSFLGIGLPASEVTWGSMMSTARENPDAWWLAVFPGLCIFLLIWMLNQAADALLNEIQTDRLQQSPHF